MPHVTIQYTANLDPEANMGVLCSALAEVLCAQRDGEGKRVFPIGGTRVLAYPAAAFAVADGAPDRAFVYLNVRIAPGRAPQHVAAAGEALDGDRCAATSRHCSRAGRSGSRCRSTKARRSFDVKHSNLHPLFAGK